MSKKRLLLLLGSVVATLSLVVLLRAAVQRNTPALPVYATVPDFELIDSAGQPFASKQIQGKTCLVNFIFTSCQGVCPLITAEMARIRNKFTNRDDIHFVSISVDPETDTPERLALYAKKFNADPSRWHFLTGRKEVIQKLMEEGFLLGFDNEPVFHSDRFVLIDSESQIRGYYSFADKKAFHQLPKDLASLF